MGRPVILSNGHILVGLDDYGTVHDFYYPYIGEENLSSARNLNHKIGVWAGDKFSWIDDGTWQIEMNFESEALVGTVKATNSKLGVQLDFEDFVDARYPAFCRQIRVTNLSGKDQQVRLFLHQAFEISRAGRSDTALYVPEGHYILDYKGWVSLLTYAENAQTHEPFDQFAVGNCGIEGKEGTYRDAEDGELSGSLVEHGGVDSVVRLVFDLAATQQATANYWVVVADSQLDVENVHKVLLEKGLGKRLASTRESFADWLHPALSHLAKVDQKYLIMAKKSLLVIKSHIDNHGGIIASADSSIYNYGRDYYSYVWPRDAAYAIMPLIELGYQDEPKKFFEFCADTVSQAGYMMHKYQTDRALGSTWHPLLHKNHPELPIQEDETASVICALKRYLQVSNDEDFVRKLYDKFVAPAANFMTSFVDYETGLPHASYDLWEQQFATFTYTVFTTIAALKAAAYIAERLHKPEDSQKWLATASRILNSTDLLVDAHNVYQKSIFLDKTEHVQADPTLDASSFYGALLLEESDAGRLAATVEQVEKKLLNSSPIGGVPRYIKDDYFKTDPKAAGNPWIITTLWLAQYYIRQDRTEEARGLIDWVIARASFSGMLAEQADPVTGMGVGVMPLVWSHSTLLQTLLMLADKNIYKI